MSIDRSYKEALDQILVLCNQSTRYSRRTQSIHNTAMIALGMTLSQRTERHTGIMQRCEEFKENQRNMPLGDAKRIFKENSI